MVLVLILNLDMYIVYASKTDSVLGEVIVAGVSETIGD